ncbi:4-carboxymuconolactone decarboxylase domain/alkylhydroperoxidase AhpD family core domain protein [plant metagenome]|uniref:4-carboxymuconolactone decarboxylase domain/alkylhydroperoxidase AhpD family core domain protein n=1 Tax=plant metagenome TaxID=1297885 RepID=A0A484UYJ7_9ZZZZ
MISHRLNYYQLSAEAARKYLDFNDTAKKRPINAEMADLVTIRASQLNGCAFCLDMHVKEAKLHGERELRVHHLSVWHESPLFNPRERAALAWTEALTHLHPRGISDEVYDAVRAVLSDEEIADLSFMIVAINGWNRLGVAFEVTPGSADALYGLDKAGLN